MELSHLLKLVSELPNNSTLSYVRSTETCRFLDVDITGERINSETPTKEHKSWAPSYLQELASKIKENVPFNLSGILNNKGSFRPVIETIIAHTREFYIVRKGTATTLVWIPSKPKVNLELEEIKSDDIPFTNDNNTDLVNVAIIKPLNDSYSDEDLQIELKKMYNSLGVAGIHLFGIKFGNFLLKKDLKELCNQAGINESYHAEINKGRNVYKAIKDKHFGICFFEDIKYNLKKDIEKLGDIDIKKFDYLRAMRTKPFLLLAGISGTGKSRIVKQMAFDSCPDIDDLRKDPTSPGNYCLIEVKPNWHDSTELLGYESKIGGDHYVLTPFVKFLAKAMLFPEVPFFVCLDEMNLAPVEQYFAEFLSVLESRTKIYGQIVSEPLIKADIFKKYPLEESLFNKEEPTGYQSDSNQDEKSPLYGKGTEVYSKLCKEGLRIPENVIIIGTVNMDETTHQFSRKVIDRAMTIEMNLPEGDDEEGNPINPFKAFFDNRSELTYREEPNSPSIYLSTETKASDVINKLSENDVEKTELLKERVAEFLSNLNSTLDSTPFKVAYRVQNELLLYFYQLWLENPEADWEQLLATSADQILMMKVLPRIEGDEELLEEPIKQLITFCTPYHNASNKLKEMQERLNKSRFTSFWP